MDTHRGVAKSSTGPFWQARGTAIECFVACVMLLAGCGDHSKPQAAAPVLTGHLGNQAMIEDDAGQSRVMLVNPHPDGVVIGGDEERSLLLNAIVSELNERPVPIQAMRLIAWCTKADALFVPPRLHEEVLVLVSWEHSGTTSLGYLSRDVQNSIGETGGWELGRTDFSDQMRSSRSFEDIPSEAEMVDFVRSSNFGNNDFSRDYIVGTIVLYENEYPDLLKQLQTGISRQEQEARRQRANDAVADPLDDVP